MIWTEVDLFLLNKLEVVVLDIFNHKDINNILPIKQKKKEFKYLNRYVNMYYKARKVNHEHK